MGGIKSVKVVGQIGQRVKTFSAKIKLKLSIDYRSLGQGVDHYSDIKERGKRFAA